MTKSRGIRKPKGTRALFVAANQGRYLCGCGCGEPIALQPMHFNVGVPRYRHGHNPQPRRQGPPQMPCGCGCGELATAGRRFISGHNNVGQTRSDETRRLLASQKVGEGNPMYGKVAPNSKGGYRTKHGYVVHYDRDHPFASHGKVFSHRLVMERHLREKEPKSPHLIDVDGVMYLRPELEIHHLNEVKDDNRVENLAVMTTADHARHHANVSNPKRKRK